MFAVQSSLSATTLIELPSETCQAEVPMEAAWPLAAKAIEKQTGSQVYSSFLAQLCFERETAGIVELSTPTMFLARYVLNNYTSIILENLRKIRPEVVSIAVRVRGVTIKHKAAPPAPIRLHQPVTQPAPAPVVEIDLVVPVERPQRHTIHWLQGVAGDHFGVTRDELVSPSRAQRLIIPRQVAMYFARVVFKKSTGDIGRRFGGRDHTTVIHAIKKIEALIQAEDEVVQAALAKIQELVDQGVEVKDLISVQSEPMAEALSA